MALTPWLHVWVATMAIASSASAQPRRPEEPRKYIEFKIDPNFEKTFRDRLIMERQLGPLKDLAKKIAADPGKFPINEQQLRGMKLDDPHLQKALKDWVSNDPELKRQLKDWMKNKATTKQLQQLKRIIDEAPERPNPPENVKLPNLPAKIEPAKPKADPLVQATEHAMKEAENTKLGDWLRDSPAWRRAFADLRTAMDTPQASRFKLGDWQNKVRLPEGKLWQLGEGVIDRVRQLPRPNAERWIPTVPGMNLRLPAIAVPAVPDVGGPALPSISTWAVWLLLIVFFVLVGWQTLRWSKRSAAVGGGARPIGPWPVRPDAVTTRTELVQAFDYLAILTLSLDVRSWNHHAVARSWQQRSPACLEPAAALALLYEQARYTPGAEALTETQRERARRSLLQIAEAL